MNCEILTIGSEITLGLSLDLNSYYIARELGKIGIEAKRILSVPDDVKMISSTIEESLNRVDLLIITGGLGPTADDLTRDAIAKHTGKKLFLSNDSANLIKKRYFNLKRPMPEIVLKQAYLPEGAVPIIPTLGTAPGLIIEIGKKIILALPGVPTEMKEMFHRAVVPYLKKRVNCGEIIDIATFKVCGLSEVEIQKKIEELLADEKLTVSLLPHPGEVNIQIAVKGKPVFTREVLLEAEKKIRENLGDYVFEVNEETLEKVIGELLRKRKQTLSVAESCTGGLLSNRITNISGSSDYFQGGIVSYNNDVKSAVLGVPREILKNYGAVSSQTAKAMAKGVAQICDTDISVALTGIAGPAGGSKDKPVGTVFIALWSKKDTYCGKFQLSGLREEIKWEASQKALEIIRSFLLKNKGELILC
ncbi:competence/damage-inducible protein A [Candidatus Oleimmundimicrobium sp.]|uniref:competence/damage-inducible protein A n=1 Tax=Candidatus Oleimmundimicrobium sp. TaxID=3060597 RepID=UPI00271FC340|nr:competence/damage-inducible protein A [Candidatus Oleimmundimicrobium sp.]MDO8885431.1 competence/damage-inducible protein A [Candidatus Oleimmundimicrobium sp.]